MPSNIIFWIWIMIGFITRIKSSTLDFHLREQLFSFRTFSKISLILYMFDFRLKVFYTVARRLNFTKAAEELAISQPAVSKHIKELESQFNLVLFDRRGNKVFLSPAGDILLKHTEAMHEIYRQLEFDLNQLNQTNKGVLHVGSSTSITQSAA